MTLKKCLCLLLAIPCLLFSYQNCGSGYLASSTNTQASNGDSSLQPDPNGPSAKNYELPAAVTPLFKASDLDWNLDETSSDFLVAVKGLADQCTARREAFNAIKRVVPVILDEGLLPGDPRIAEMRDVKSAMDMVLNIAFCAYVASTPQLRQDALNTVVNYIIEWNTAYEGDGNPINDRFFVQLFLAADLLTPKMTEAQINAIKNLASRMDAKEVTFMARLGANDDRLRNNWMTRHLVLRVYANILLNNTTNLNTLQSRLNDDIRTQYTAPTGFQLSSTCANLRSVGSYGSFDLQQRDAFLYHASGINELTALILLRKGLFTIASLATLKTAVEVFRPYVLGEKIHPEFQCTKVQYDRDKLALQPSLGANWDPNTQRNLFRYSRLIWPETMMWTERFLTTEYHPWFKIFVVGHGDRLVSPNP